jgi:hypothetical protein
MVDACPLYPEKRTLIKCVGMSALCQSEHRAFYSMTSSARESSSEA